MAGENIFYSYLARCNREPWLLLEFIDLLPDLLELGPDSLEILQLLESHLDPLLTGTHRTCHSKEKVVYIKNKKQLHSLLKVLIM